MSLNALHRFLPLALLLLAGCLPSQQAPTKADFRAADTPTRVPAIVNASGTDDQAALGELVHALSDDDAAVRLFAIQSLKERTGQTMGYRYYDAKNKRQAAVDRWHQWLADADEPNNND